MGKNEEFDLETILGRLRNRREFLQLFGKGLGYGALATVLPACGGGDPGVPEEDSPPDAPPAPPARPLIPKADPEYSVLKRTSFGPHRDELASIRTLGIDAYLERQLDHETILEPALEAEIANRFPLAGEAVTPSDLLAGFPDNIFDVATQMIAATQYRQMFSKRQLFEVMVEFWSDHFNIHLVNGLGPTLKPLDDRAVIREHALGNFGDLLRASAKSPAMLFYLDNFLNVGAAPNENYARELMELHTLGVDGGYTEDDVKQVARCFTGWSLRFPGDPFGDYGDFVFRQGDHDVLDKKVLGIDITYHDIRDGEQVLDILLAHPSTADFIATKLCRRFISDTPSKSAIDAVATAFTSSGGDIGDTLRALFATPAFVDSSDLKFTRPSEYLAALVRALAPDTPQIPYPPDRSQFWFFAQSILGQLPFYWPTPDGYPDLQGYWASTGGLLNRWRLSFLGFAGILPGIDALEVDYPAMLAGADTIDTVVDAITEAVLMRPLAREDRAVIVQWLVDEVGVGADDVLPPGAPGEPDPSEFVSALVAAVLVSSVYFHLR